MQFLIKYSQYNGPLSYGYNHINVSAAVVAAAVAIAASSSKTTDNK